MEMATYYDYEIVQFKEDLFLVDLPQKKRGYRRFTCSWVFKRDDITALIDTGPASTVKKLVEALEKLGVLRSGKGLDFIFLTHIHLDHAGAVGHLLDYCEDVKVVVHPKGIRHLVDPTRLWQGSLSVLGEIAELYGKPEPVSEDKIIKDFDSIDMADISFKIIDTPGHAPHHQSYLIDGYLFTGDSAGVYLDVDGKPYLRPATPPKFVLDTYVSSINKSISLGDFSVCFAHFGLYEDGVSILKDHIKQIKLWCDEVKALMDSYPDKEKEFLFKEAKKVLLEKDPLFALYNELDDDIKERESDSINATLWGIYDMFINA